LLQGGAIYIEANAICSIVGASFVSNTAIYVSRAAPELSRRLAIFLPGISQLFFSFLTFCYQGGAIAVWGEGTCNIDGGAFLSNIARSV
jgi:hypothetical protein